MNVRDSEFDRLLADWLEDDPFVAPAGPVEAAVDFARSHPRRRDWLAFLRRNAMTTRSTGLRPVAIIVAVVALLALAIGGAVLIGSRPDPTPTPMPSATAIPSPSATPVAVQPLPAGTAPLAPGRYTGGLVAPGEPAVAGPGEVEIPVDVEFTVNSGWSVGQYPEGVATCCWYINGERRSISYWPVSEVYPDACRTYPDPLSGESPARPIGPSVDDLVTALDEQKHTVMSPPVDVTVGGYPGMRFEMSLGDRLPDSCTALFLWPDIGGDPGRGFAIDGGPGEDVQPVYVIDVEGNRVVFVAWSTGTDPEDEDAIADVMQSMEFSVR